MEKMPNKHLAHGFIFAYAWLVSSLVFAVEPMTEIDLGGISADIGYNPIEMFGAPSAGLVSEGYDISLNKVKPLSSPNASSSPDQEKESDSSTEPPIDQYSEGNSTKDFASNELRDIEVSDMDKDSIITAFNIDEEAFEEAIHAGEYVVTNTKFLTSETTSEVRYKESNIHHESIIQPDGSVKGQAEVQIDVFKFEHLMGDNSEGRDAGNLIISDFAIQTRTHTFMHE